MFELQGTINQGDDAEPINYAAVISSVGYPDNDPNPFPRTFINKIPVGAYVTYTLLTSIESNDHIVQITDSRAFSTFNMGLSSPFSLKHEGEKSAIIIGTTGKPVFLLKYTGKPQTLSDRLC